MKTVAPLRYGVIFKKAFCDVEVFKGFVRDILGIHLSIEKVETEKEFKPAIGQVAVKFDLYAQDEKERVIVEIQHRNFLDHYDRFLHYHCVALLEQVKTAKNYKPPLAVYTIVVLTSPDQRYEEDILTIDFDLKTKDGKSLNAIPHKVIYLCPHYCNENTPVALREWLQVIDDSLDGQIDEANYHLPEVQKILSHIEQEVSPEEKARMIEEAHLDEIETVARKEGVSEGIKIGYEKGIEKGIEQGEKRKAQTMAKSMLAKGIPLVTVLEITGLDEADILSNVI